MFETGLQYVRADFICIRVKTKNLFILANKTLL